MKYLSFGIVLTLLPACSFNQQDTLEVQAIEVGALLSKNEIQNAPIAGGGIYPNTPISHC